MWLSLLAIYRSLTVYFPCAGSANRLFICEEMISELLMWVSKYPDKTIIVGGDFNCTLGPSAPMSKLINTLIGKTRLVSYHSYSTDSNRSYLNTYLNDKLDHESTIDHFLISNRDIVSYYDVLDPDLNLSDHRHITG